MYKPNLAQFKLTSGHEIICELIAEFNPEEDSAETGKRKLGENEILARNILMIIPVDYNGERKFMFRPFLQYAESSEDLIILNSAHIVSMNRPNIMLVNDYKISLAEIHEEYEERKKDYAREVSKHVAKVRQAFEQNLKSWMEGDSAAFDLDNDPLGVVVPFPTKNDKIH